MTDFRLRATRFVLRAAGALAPNFAASEALKIFSTPRRVPRPPWENKLVKTGQRMSFLNDLVAYSWGEGPVIVLVHGWQGRGSQLGTLVEPLVAAGYRVVALDGPAHGESPGEQTNVLFFSRAISIAIKSFGPVHALIGHSFGGAAVALALRDGLKADRAVIVAAPSDMQRVVDEFKKLADLSPRVGHALQKQIEEWIGCSVDDLSVARAAAVIKTPALIIHDPKDAEVAFLNAEAIHSVWLGSRLLPMEGGHRKILKSPAFVAAVLEFLN